MSSALQHFSYARRNIRLLVLLLAWMTIFGVLTVAPASAQPAGVVAGSGGAHSPGEPGYDVLAARWWQWALQQPTATNPLLDPTGASCGAGQRGPLWFLAGTPFPDPVHRRCTIPPGKALFFPLVNIFSGATASDPPENKTEAYQRAAVAAAHPEAATQLSLTVDGRAVRRRVVQFERSVVFTVQLPADNIFGAPATDLTVYPTVDAGYYAWLPPLRPGRHVIHFTGKLPDYPLVDVTYILTVCR